MEQEDVEAAKRRREEARRIMEEVTRVNMQALELRQKEADAIRAEEQRQAQYLKVSAAAGFCLPLS